MSYSNRPSSQCQIDAYNSAHKQNTFYDDKTNQMLYGRSSLMRVTGVSDGTCNQINPLMLRHQAKCGTGVAGGNPCYPNTVEPFESNASQGCNISGFVTMLFLILIFLLFININYYENNQLVKRV
jgi:hypothetical protein